MKHRLCKLPSYTVLACTVFAALLCSGCATSSVKETLGLKKTAPDEFLVLSHPALTVPPNFTLSPPGDVTHEFDSDNLRTSARETLVGSNRSNLDPKSFSKGESSLLRHANADKIDPKIREKLRHEREAAIEDKAEKEDNLVDKALTSIRPAQGDPVIDPASEEKRIEANKKDGKPVNEGDVEVIDPKKKPIIDLNF